jgi:hypothetical protein
MYQTIFAASMLTECKNENYYFIQPPFSKSLLALHLNIVQHRSNSAETTILELLPIE